MGADLVLGCIVGLIVIFLPGSILLKGLHLRWQECLVCAPAPSAAAYAVAGVLCHALGLTGAVPLGCVTLLGVLAVASCCFAFIAAREKRRDVASEKSPDMTLPSWKAILLYVVVGLIMMAYLYLECLSSLDAIIPFGDNDYHLAVVTSMMDSGNFSTLSVSAYPDTLPEGETPLHDAGYYPAVWHAMTALMGSIADLSPMMAEHVSLYLFCGAAFPLSVLTLLSRVFPGQRSVIVCGAFVTTACAAFPLRPLVVHQIYPNVAGFCCLLCVVALFLAATTEKGSARRAVRYAFAFFCGAVGLATLHPGSLLACAPFLFSIVLFVAVPRIVERLNGLRERIGSRAAIIMLGCLWTLVFLLAWVVMLDLPALYSTTHFLWEWTVPAWKALVLVITLALRCGIPQFLLAALAWLGLGLSLKDHRKRWLALSGLLCCLIFFCNAAGDPDIKRLFAGFWYTDPERTAALTGIAIIPLAALGLGTVSSWIARLIARLRGKAAERSFSPLAAVIAIALFFPLNYLTHRIPLPLPSCDGDSAFSVTRQAIRYESDPEFSILYSADEMAFVDRAKEVADLEEGVILNMPYDGSLYAYPLDGLDVYYRSHLSSDPTIETPESALLRESIDEVASKEEVREAAQSANVRFVLKLHQDEKSNYDRNQWDPEDWIGIDAITDETPGFEAILSEDDLRLYRITVVD